ncbi:MAG: protein-tyrosine phosphatase family protein [Caulobacterales bacterium]
MTILVCSLSKVPEVARTRGPSRLVSLLDPNSNFPKNHGVPHHLALSMHDINEEHSGWNAPAHQQIEELIGFVEQWDRAAAPILIHCYAGISRSTATAFVTACVHNPRADEEVIAWALRTSSISAWPNKRIIALADAHLGRNGRMIRAIETIGPGRSWEEIGEAEPFELVSSHT